MLAETSLERIGLFGGSFDPPHLGHVALVEAALSVLKLSAVWVLPVGLPVHRNLSGCAQPEERLEWMRRVFDGHPQVMVQDWEIVAGTAMPSITTLRRFAAERPGEHPVVLLGADAFAAIDTWVDYPEHAELCDVAVFGRTGSSRPPSGTAFRSMPLADWLAGSDGVGKRVDVNIALPDVSATQIRRMAQEGKSLAGKVPECVRRDIEQAYGTGLIRE